MQPSIILPLADQVIESVARLCHEQNRNYCLFMNEPNIAAPWDELSESMRESVRTGVRNIVTGVVTAPHESHEKWLEFKGNEGWTYGEVKDFEKKTHPCFRPYQELPQEQRVKDALFFNTVKNVIDNMWNVAGLKLAQASS